MTRDTNFKINEYQPSKLTPTAQKYEYNPNEPSQTGMYGGKENHPKAKKSGPKKQEPGQRSKNQFGVTQRYLKTYETYKLPSGPDIKAKDMPPVREYRYRDPDIARLEAKEAQMNRPTYKDRKELPTGEADYKLTEKNNLGMRHFHNDYLYRRDPQYYRLTEGNNLGMRHFHDNFVDDTIMHKLTEPRYGSQLVPRTPKEKPVAAVQPVHKKPKSPKEDKKPVPAPIFMPPPPPKKKLVNSSTQHIAPANKTSNTQTTPLPVKASGTQYEKTTTKSMNIQTDTPIVPIVAAGAVMAPPPNKKPLVSKSVQATDSKKVAVTGTQCSGPPTKQANIQTSPIAFVTQPPRRTPSPKLVYEEMRQTEPYDYQERRRTPSPQMVQRSETYTPPYQNEEWSPTPVVPVVVPVRHDTPKYRQNTPPYRQNTPPYRQNTPPYQQNTPPYQQNTPPYRQNTPTYRQNTPPYQQNSPPNRLNTPPRRTPPREYTPPRRETPERVRTPARIETPRWESPVYQTPAPSERAISPPAAHAPVFIPPPSPKRQSPVYTRSPDPAPVVIPTQYEPKHAPVYPTRERSRILETPVSPEVTPPRRVYSPVQATPYPAPMTPQRHSPERASPVAARDSMYPQPAQAHTPPFYHPAPMDTQQRQPSPLNTNAFAPYSSQRWRLPPEVNHCIEAYDNAHTDAVGSGNSLPSVRRTMNYT